MHLREIKALLSKVYPYLRTNNTPEGEKTSQEVLQAIQEIDAACSESTEFIYTLAADYVCFLAGSNGAELKINRADARNIITTLALTLGIDYDIAYAKLEAKEAFLRTKYVDSPFVIKD